MSKPAPSLKKVIYSVVILLIIGIAVTMGTPWFSGGNTLSVSGLVQAKEIKNASRFGGRIKEVLVKEGDIVQQGQKLVIFDDMELRSKIAEARALLNQAKARQGILTQGADREDIRQASSQVQQAEQNLKMIARGPRADELTQANAKVQEATGRYQAAKSAYDNSKSMLEEGIISQQKYNEIQAQYETAQSMLDSAKANARLMRSGSRPEQVSIARSQVASAKAQYDKLLKGTKPGEIVIASSSVDQAQSVLDSLDAQLSELVITAPISGMVTILSVSPGELISPSRPIVSIIDYNHLWTDLYIPETSLNMVKVDQKVKVSASAYPGKTFEGRVAFISPKSEFVPGGGGSSSTSEQASFRIKVELHHLDIENAIQLHPGMKVQVDFSQPG